MGARFRPEGYCNSCARLFPRQWGAVQMKRRDFIALLGGAATAWPLAASAQTSPKIPRVGFIGGGSPAMAEHTLGAFRKALIELGYVEGQSIALEVRYAEGRMEGIPELVAELLDLKMDLLVAGVSSVPLARKKGARSTPLRPVAPNTHCDWP